MLKYFILIFLVSFSLFAQEVLKENYYVNSQQIKISDVLINSQDDTLLYTILKTRHSKRVKSKNLMKLLQKYGYKGYTAKHPYIQFTQRSPIDTSALQIQLEQYYHSKYKNITIRHIEIHPRSFTQNLPDSFTLKFQRNKYLFKQGIFSIKSDTHYEIFFNYTIDAMVSIVTARKSIKRNEELSPINTKTKTVQLRRFQAIPLQTVPKNALQSKHNIKKDTIITQRDISKLFMVKKGTFINVSLDNASLSISFSAKAKQNGCLGDTITVVKNSGKKLTVRVSGKSRAEVR